MLATDWVSVSAIATAGATLVLAVATFASVRSANRAAERSLLAGLRPVPMPGQESSAAATSAQFARQISSGTGGSTSSQIAANDPAS